MRNLRRATIGLTLTALLVACDDNGDGAFGGGGGGGGAPALNAADMPGVSPCPNQAILTDAAQFATFQTALQNGTFLYRDVPFNGADPNIFVKKCGLGAFWDPAESTDEIAPPSVPVRLADLFQFGNAGICAAGFDNGSFGTGEGLPVAGTYRKEFKVAHLGTTYLVRARVTVSGPSAGATWASLGIAVPADLENTLGYEVDGTPSLHDDVLTDIAAALQSPDASVTLDVFDMPGGGALLSAVIEVICVEIL
jgi:hypothetical protein